MRHVRAENAELKQQLADAQIQLQQQRALADRSRGLDRLLELRERLTLNTVAAEVIASGASPEFRTLTIDKGTQQGVRPDMAVIAPAGVVGRVVVPSLRAAKVQLIIDRNAAAGALIERSRAQGVVVGAGDELLRLEYVSEIADVGDGRRRRHLGHRRDLPEGLHHRPGRGDRAERPAPTGASRSGPRSTSPVSKRSSSC